MKDELTSALEFIERNNLGDQAIVGAISLTGPQIKMLLAALELAEAELAYMECVPETEQAATARYADARHAYHTAKEIHDA